ncbi:MAG TPA: carboxypeptidase regulatory-like domain-containing protein [Longimicrobiales bacterium]
MKTLAFALALALCYGHAAPAQIRAGAGDTLRGRVLDASTGRPVPVAVVRSLTAERAVVTDSSGSFALGPLMTGDHRLEAGRIGFRTTLLPVNLAGADTVTIYLVPQPIALEAITAVSNRLERRRERVSSMVHAFEAKDLALATEDLRQYLRTRGVPLVSCSAAPGGESGADCVWVRGRYRTVNLYFNEMKFTGAPLSLYYPLEFELIEYYHGAATIRLYTTDFLERVARGKAFIADVLY